MVKKLILFFAFILSVFFISSANAATYYISPAGSDANPGTSALPWVTFNYALITGMIGGDTLIIKDGEYTESIGYFNQNQPYNSWSPKNGSVSAYTIIKAENDGKAVIRNAGVYIGGKVENGIATGSSYVQLEGLKLNQSSIVIDHSYNIKIFF